MAQRLEIHHTPKHGSWLNIAEIELSAWQAATNADQRQVDWQFTTDDARVKLRHLYPN